MSVYETCPCVCEVLAEKAAGERPLDHERFAYLLALRMRSPYFQNRNGLNQRALSGSEETNKKMTYEGIPTTIAKHARIVSPLPYPSALYIAGANSGKPKPARERRNVTAASAKNAATKYQR